MIGKRYIGISFDNFVLAHGSPIRQFTLSNGDITYVWNSGVSTVSIGDDSKIDMECELQFLTSSDGIVKSITALKDTAGFWKSSRCREIFKD